MKSILFYLLQVVASSGLLYGYYHFFLRNKKFHQYNRYYLLTATVISILVPFLNIPVYFTRQEYQGAAWLVTLSDISSPAVFVTAEKKESFFSFFTWQNVLIALYLLAAALLLARLLAALVRIKSLLRKYKAEKLENDVYFVNTSEKDTPFSFFKWMFWNNKVTLQSENGQQMFRHELFHIKQKHSWDTIFIEALAIVFWINPFFYLIRRELKVIHEFLADQFAIRENDQWNYAELLLMHLLDSPHLRLTHPFFHNQIKRRIAMITSSKKPKYQYIRKVLALPLIALIAILFAFTYKQKQETLDRAAAPLVLNDAEIIDTVPKRIALKMTAGSKAKPKEAEQYVELPIDMKVTEGKPLYIIDGVVIGKSNSSALSALQPDQIREINIFKGQDAAKIYGQSGADGVIEIKTKENIKIALSKSLNDDEIQADTAFMTKEDVTNVVSYLKEKLLELQPSEDKEVVVVGYALSTPRFPGGGEEWRKFLQRNLNSNIPVEKGAPVGMYKVNVEFLVDENGAVSDIKALSQHGYGMEEEVIRVIKTGPSWEPAKREGKVVKANKKQPVVFVVSEENEALPLQEVVVTGYKKATRFHGTVNYNSTKADAPEVDIDKLSPLYPNPASNNVAIPFNTPNAGNGEIRIHDIHGKTHQVTKVTFSKGLNTLQVNVSPLNAGVYFITVVDATNKPARAYKLVKQ